MKCDINIKRPSYGYQPENIKTGSSAIAAVDQTVKCHDLPACWVIGVCFERNERTDFDEVDATPAWHVLLIGTMWLIITVINSICVPSSSWSTVSGGWQSEVSWTAKLKRARMSANLLIRLLKWLHLASSFRYFATVFNSITKTHERTFG